MFKSNGNHMKILIVGPGDSPHSTYALINIRETFPSAEIMYYSSVPFKENELVGKLTNLIKHDRNQAPPSYYWDLLYNCSSINYSGNVEVLKSVIDQFKPDFIHYFAIQDAGYLVASALNNTSHKPIVIGSIFGNDIQYFRHDPNHKKNIEHTLNITDRILTENYRDCYQAPQLGFRGSFTTVPSVSLANEKQIKSKIGNVALKKYKDRKSIIIKGGNLHRSSNMLITSIIDDYVDLLKINEIHFVMPDFRELHLISKIKNIPQSNIFIYKNWLPNQKLLEIISESKIAISLNSSDGNPTFFFECMMSGCYPILSKNTSLSIYSEDYHYSLVDPFKEEELRGAIEKLQPSNVDMQLEKNKDIINLFSKTIIRNAILQIYYQS